MPGYDRYVPTGHFSSDGTDTVESASGLETPFEHEDKDDLVREQSRSGEILAGKQ